MNETTQTPRLITPYGGRLVDLVATGAAREALVEQSRRLPNVQISPRSVAILNSWRPARSRLWIAS
jgi:hypothetical protein